MMRARMRSSQVVPSRHGVHLPQDSLAKKRTMRQAALTTSVVSSITTIAPEPTIEPALSTVGLSSGRSRCSSKNHIAEAPPGMNAFTARPPRTPPQYSGDSISCRKVVMPLGTSKTPGRFTCPDTENIRMPVEVGAPSALNAAPPFSTIHGTLARVSTLFTMVGCRYRPLAAGK
jgi:hypothetical protein